MGSGDEFGLYPNRNGKPLKVLNPGTDLVRLCVKKLPYLGGNKRRKCKNRQEAAEGVTPLIMVA